MTHRQQEAWEGAEGTGRSKGSTRAAGTGAEGTSKGSIHSTKRTSPHCMLTHAKHRLPRWTQSSAQLVKHRSLRPRWSLQLLLTNVLSGTARILTPATPPVSVHVFSYGYKRSACGQSLEVSMKTDWRQWSCPFKTCLFSKIHLFIMKLHSERNIFAANYLWILQVWGFNDSMRASGCVY